MPITPEQEQQFVQRMKEYSAPQNDYLAAVAAMPEDQALKILRLSMHAGVDPQEAAKNPHAVIQNLIGASDFEDVGKFAPLTYSFLNDPLHMAVIRNRKNVMTLADMESESKIGTALRNGLKNLARNALNYARGAADALAVDDEAKRTDTPVEDLWNEPGELWRELGGKKLLKEMGAGLGKAADAKWLKRKEVTSDWGPNIPIVDRSLGQLGLDFAETVPQIAAQWAAHFLTGGIGAMAFMGTQIAGGDYEKLRKEGVAPDRAFAAATMDAILQAPLERVGLNKLFKKIPANSSRAFKVRELAERALTEAFTEFLQQFPEAITEIWAKNPQMTPDERDEEFYKHFGEITKEGLYQGLVALPFGLLGGAGHIALQKKATQAFVQHLERQQAIIANSALRNVPEVLEIHGEQVDGDKVYIEPKPLMVMYQEQGPEVLEKLGVSEEVVANAAQTGHMVEVSKIKYNLASVDDPAIHETLKNDIAPDEEGYTMRRANECSVKDIEQAAAEVNQRRAEVRKESDRILKQWTDSGVSHELARLALLALTKNAYVMSDNPAQFLREKAPIVRKGLPGKPGALYYQYAGPGAHTADHLQLAAAEEMERQGKTNEEIRQATGWFKGMDGKWRFEIDDSQARFIGPEQFKAMESEIAALYKRANRTKDPVKKEELRAQAESRFQQFKQDAQALLKNVLEHPVLYKAYPWLADTKVVYNKLKEGHKGGYDPATNTIELNSALSPEEMKKTLMHEVQHVIQVQENFARGGSPESVRGMLSDKAKSLAKSLVSLEPDKQQLLEDWYKASKLSTAEDLTKLKATEQQIKEFDPDGKLRDARVLLGKMDKSLDTLTSQQLYERLAGEIEARDTASRSDLTEEQRREIAPDLRSDAIVVHGGREYGYRSQELITPEENIRRGTEAMRQVIQERTDVLDAMYRQDLGGVSFYWGTPGKGKKFKGGSGISHIVAKRNAEDGSGEQTALKLVEVIAKGSLTQRQEQEGGSRVLISYDGYTAVLSLYKDGNLETWLLTGWKNNEEAPGATGEVYDSPGATASEPTRFQSGGEDASTTDSIPKTGELFQSETKKGEIKKGSIHWEDGRAIITLFENSDPSTLIHEMVGHFFVQNLIDMGAKEDAPDWMKKDRKTALEYVGIADWDAATDSEKIAAHEKLARAAEAYIMEGKAPSLETKGLFRKFAEWLTEIYLNIKELNVELNPEIRAVFDRMLATQEEIAHMEQIQNYHQRLPQDVLDTLTPAQREWLDKSLSDTHEKAEDILRGRLLKRFTAEQKQAIAAERERITPQIEEETANEPLYLAAEKLRSYAGGRNPRTIAYEYLKKQTTEDQAILFDMIAGRYGFTSTDHLMKRIVRSKDLKNEIQARIDGYIANKFGDIYEQRNKVREAAEEAMYSDEGAMLLAVEDQILQEKLGRVISREEQRRKAAHKWQLAKASADSAMAKLPLEKAMRLQTWIAAERRAAENVQKALARKDFVAAQEQKEIQLYNHAMVMKSLEIRREFERINNYLKRQQKSDKATWVNEADWFQAADLLRRFGFVRKDFDLSRKIESLSQYIARQTQENPDMVRIADWLALNDEQYNPRKLTIDDYRDVANAIRNIKRMAKAGVNGDNFVLLNDNGVAATVNELVDTANANCNDVLVDKLSKEDVGWIERFKAGLDKPSQLFRKMDSKDFGIWDRMMYHFVQQAQDIKSRLLQQVFAALEAAYASEGISKAERYRDAHKEIYIEEWGISATKNELRAFLLNMGSQSNLERLLGTPPVALEEKPVFWNEQAIKNVLTKYLEAKDFRLAQKIWNAINLLYDPYTAMVKRMTGFPLEKVPAQPIDFTMPDGSVIHLDGGYYPLKMDPRGSKQAELNAEQSLANGFVGVMPYPNTGASKSRVKGAQYAIDPDLTNLYRHINDVAHDIAFRPVMHDINKLMRQDPIPRILRRKLGEGKYQAIVSWQKAIARGRDTVVESAGMFDAAANVIRQRAVIASLLFRVGAVFQNAANFTLYGNAVEGFSDKDAFRSWMQYGWSEYIPHALTGSAEAQKIRDFVYSKSTLMRDKLENPDYGLRELHGIGAQENRLMKSQNEVVQTAGIRMAITHEKVVEFGSWMLAFADQLTDIPMWRGAYFKALAEGKAEAEAVRFADTVIERSTGSGRQIDTSQMQRGSPTDRLLSMFMTFLNTQYNRWAMEYNIYLKEKDLKRLMTFVGVRYVMFGLLSALASFKLPDKDEELWEWFVREVMEWPLGMIPVGGSMAKFAFDSAMGFKTYSFSVSPAERNLEDILKLVTATKKAASGEREPKELAEAASTAAAFLFKYPDQLNDWFWNAYDILNEGMEPQFTDLIKRRPRRER